MNFDANANTPQEKKKGFNDLAIEFYPYWKPLFEHINVPNPVFKSKLAYNSSEFQDENGNKKPAIRFFESELNSLEPVFIECVDWDTNFYDPMNRTLYKLNPNPHWKGEPDKYVKSNAAKHVTYAIKLNDLEKINTTSITEKTPKFTKETEEVVTELTEDDYSDLYKELDDNHMSSMTMRDKYCITHGVPRSNKKWLNELIKKGKEWQKQNQ